MPSSPSRLLPVVAMLLAFLPPRAPAAAQNVMSDVRGDRWAEAETEAERYPDPVVSKLVTYYRLLAPDAAGAAEIARFMAESPDWPLQGSLARRRDEALAREPDSSVVQDLCDHAGPQSAPALERCAEAYSTLGRTEDAAASARKAWIAAAPDPAWEATFMQRWGSVLTPADQRKRFDRLAWSDTAGAARQAARLDPADHGRAEARLALRRDDASAPALVAALPPEQRNEPPVMLEQARWLRRAGQDQDALALWIAAGYDAESTAPAERRSAFWDERNILARRRLQQGDAAGAYALAAGHAQTGAEQVADAEFLAGFIALQRLADPAKAEGHFRRIADLSKAAITQGRAHYWLGRAKAARGDTGAAKAEYQAAAAFPNTFYGQLAALALGDGPAGLNARITAFRDPGWDAERALGFAGRELARAAAYLVSWGEPRRAQAFLLRLDEIAPDAVDRSIDARLAIGFGMPETAIAVARRAGREGLILLQSGWPLAADVPGGAGVEPALALGVIRQESSFDTATVSPAGARGLMQLLPETATLVGRKLGVPITVAALTTDPTANVQLGTAYLRGLLEQFDGAVPLAVAAYNAGPNRVLDWLTANGDPRGGSVDMIDWIELIPYGETRNYVQRVIENQIIYRARRGETKPHPLEPVIR
jgi:soluble lytic murein transglycosylase